MINRFYSSAHFALLAPSNQDSTTASAPIQALDRKKGDANRLPGSSQPTALNHDYVADSKNVQQEEGSPADSSPRSATPDFLYMTRDLSELDSSSSSDDGADRDPEWLPNKEDLMKVDQEKPLNQKRYTTPLSKLQYP